MLASVFWFVALLAAPATPAPAQLTPEPSPLHEIGQASAPAGVCGSLVVHANAAIAAELHNRQWLTDTVARLRSVDFEGSPEVRRIGLSELTRLSGALHDTAERGDDELHRLNEAERSSGDVRPADVRAFADALAAAFAIERRAAVDLAAFVHFLDYTEMHEIKPGVDDPMHPDNPNPFKRPPSTGEVLAIPPTSPYQVAGSANQMARAAGSDFATRLAETRTDEARAAGRSDAAVTGCS
jgi:hypothetical protein